jgi:hypothetical protein
MYLAPEAPKTFAAAEFLFALFQAIAVVAVVIWIKLVLYRRRSREDSEETRRLHQRRGRMNRLARSSANITPSDRLPQSSPSARQTAGNRQRRLRVRLKKVPASTNDPLLDFRTMSLKSYE